jgi:hypothetical protein
MLAYLVQGDPDRFLANVGRRLGVELTAFAGSGSRLWRQRNMLSISPAIISSYGLPKPKISRGLVHCPVAGGDFWLHALGIDLLTAAIALSSSPDFTRVIRTRSCAAYCAAFSPDIR